MQTKTLKIGTRGSALALAQARETRDLLIKAHGLREDDIEIVVISTSGDRIQDRPLAEVGGKGLFTLEIEATACRRAHRSCRPLIKRYADFSARKACIFRSSWNAKIRATPLLAARSSHCWICRMGPLSAPLRLRRQALIRRARPDLKVVNFRGNVETRLRKLAGGEVDATFLAYAGLKRLGLGHVVTELMDVKSFPPAPGQGAITVESRIGDDRVDALLAPAQPPSDLDGAGMRTCVPWRARWLLPYADRRAGDGFGREASVPWHDSSAGWQRGP